MGCYKLPYYSKKTASDYSLKVSHSKGFNDYFPYGKLLRSFQGGSGHERYLTTQHERDAETISENNAGTGLDFRIGRMYDSDNARFLSIDPKAQLFPSWSPFNYVLATPTMLTDPDGECPICPWLMSDAARNSNGIGAHAAGIVMGVKNTLTGIYDAVTNPVETGKALFEISAPITEMNPTKLAAMAQMYNDYQAAVNGNGYERGEVIGRYGADYALGKVGSNIFKPFSKAPPYWQKYCWIKI